MLERFYLREHLSFDEVDLEFDQNFIVFTGPSGAGKSILMEALLSLFGFKECEARVIEASVSHRLDLSAFGIEEDIPNIFRLTREKSTRYFINNQQVSKKNIKTISQRFIRYLTLREFSEFENENLLHLLDAIAAQSNPDHMQKLDQFRKTYRHYKEISQTLAKLHEEEKKVQELIEFTRFEIEKIEKIAPDPDEYDTLMQHKKALSKKEKIEQSIAEASQIFTLAPQVSQALSLIGSDSEFFDDAITRLEALFEETTSRMAELNDLDIETLLDRIEALSDLIRKHGSIRDALTYLDKKKTELAHYENLAFEKANLQQEEASLRKALDHKAQTITQNRTKALKILQSRVEHYLNLLFLESVTFTIEPAPLGEYGCDHVRVALKNTTLKKISSGELNRLRLAFLAASSEFVQSEGGILILDEIDANVSGKESMSIAKVLRQLATNYQIFAISHQPQLSSTADLHFLVQKEDGKSSVTRLDDDGRIKELSRMISAEEITDEATNFARSLLTKKQ